MHAKIVVSHPRRNSLTRLVAERIEEGVKQAGHSAELDDLMSRQFDPRYQDADIEAHLRNSPPPTDVIAEQESLDRADALVMVYPVYWWTMPALMKGWIDRVFTNGWAYEEDGASPTVKKLQHLPVHLVALPGASDVTYARHGYFEAMQKQIDHGIFDYCGAPVIRHELLFGVAGDAMDQQLENARTIGLGVFTSTGGTPRARGSKRSALSITPGAP